MPGPEPTSSSIMNHRSAKVTKSPLLTLLGLTLSTAQPERMIRAHAPTSGECMKLKMLPTGDGCPQSYGGMPALHWAFVCVCVAMPVTFLLGFWSSLQFHSFQWTRDTNINFWFLSSCYFYSSSQQLQYRHCLALSRSTEHTHILTQMYTDLEGWSIILVSITHPTQTGFVFGPWDIWFCSVLCHWVATAMSSVTVGI